MSLYDIPNMTDGIDSIFVAVVSEVPAFPIMLMVFVYFFITLTGMGMQMRRSGYADFPLWSTLAMLSVFMVNLIFSLTSGIVNPMVLGVVVALTFFSGLLLFLTRGRFEQ